jgi:hypothetical protein
MRTKGAALGTATNWIFNFMVVEITPVSPQAMEGLGWNLPRINSSSGRFSLKNLKLMLFSF